MKSTKLIYSLAFLLFASLASAAEPRIAKTYSCNAFNPLTGFAIVTYSKATVRKNGGAVIKYGLLTTETKGGEIAYDPANEMSYPKAVLSTKIGGVDYPVHLDLLRPIDHGSKEAVLAGLTYIPVNTLTVLPYWAPYYGSTTHLSPIAPVPAGFIPTSVVTCRVTFQ